MHPPRQFASWRLTGRPEGKCVEAHPRHRQLEAPRARLYLRREQPVRRSGGGVAKACRVRAVGLSIHVMSSRAHSRPFVFLPLLSCGHMTFLQPYNMSALAAFHNAVCVNFNYRTGPIGWVRWNAHMDRSRHKNSSFTERVIKCCNADVV